MMHDMADVDDEDVLLSGRPCPKVLNDFTAGQPWTDVGNKFRQHELGMEYRFPTTHFPFRLFTTMWGIVLVSAAQAFKYVWPSQFDNMTFLDFCRDAATVGVNCDLTADSDEANESDDNPMSGEKRKASASSSTKPGSRSPSKKAKAADGRSFSYDDIATHIHSHPSVASQAGKAAASSSAAWRAVPCAMRFLLHRVLTQLDPEFGQSCAPPTGTRRKVLLPQDPHAGPSEDVVVLAESPTPRSTTKAKKTKGTK
jgi:hypothetical protein